MMMPELLIVPKMLDKLVELLIVPELLRVAELTKRRLLLIVPELLKMAN